MVAIRSIYLNQAYLNAQIKLNCEIGLMPKWIIAQNQYNAHWNYKRFSMRFKLQIRFKRAIINMIQMIVDIYGQSGRYALQRLS